MLTDIEALAAFGCRFVRVARREKRPLGAAWQTRSTDNPCDVKAWLDAGSNVGLLLGPESGVIDVEFDSWPGLDVLEESGLLDCPTPTWTSSRGQHWLFRWRPWMPQSAVIHHGVFEIRLGGRAAQSVLPPSIHPDGHVYEWIESPQRCEIAELPEALMDNPWMASR